MSTGSILFAGEVRSQGERAGFVVLLMAAIPLVFLLPAHLLLKRLFPPSAR